MYMQNPQLSIFPIIHLFSINLKPLTPHHFHFTFPSEFFLCDLPINPLDSEKHTGHSDSQIAKEKKMSMEMMATERVCYVHCNFCNTILAVSVPCSSLLTIVTVRCGHCANLLSVNMGASLQPLPPHQDPHQSQKQHVSFEETSNKELGSSSKCHKLTPFESVEHEQPRIPPVRPPEKRQRVPSAYNRFIKEEIQRIKASNPDISHREAFSTAAKNWAHFPHIHFGLKLDGNKQAKLDHQGEGTQKSNGFY